MHPDIIIYVEKLKNWFKEHPDDFKTIFGDLDFDKCFIEILEISNKKFKEDGDPVLTKELLMEIRNRLSQQRLFTELNDSFPDICLN